MKAVLDTPRLHLIPLHPENSPVKEQGFSLCWQIFRQESGLLMGRIRLASRPGGEDGIAALDVALDPPFRENGYASEGARRCLRWLFDTTEIQGAELLLSPENLPGIHLAQGIGMGPSPSSAGETQLRFFLSRSAPLLPSPPPGVLIRDYQPQFCPAMARLFHKTVHQINVRDYSPPQLDAWCPAPPDLTLWNSSFLAHRTLVALLGEQVVGFGDMTPEGYLDRLYTDAAHQGMGIATALCDRLEAPFWSRRITVHASITARPFFEKRGYRVLAEQQVLRQGQLLTNFVMERPGTACGVG